MQARNWFHGRKRKGRAMSATLQFTIAVARESASSCGFATVRHSLNLERAQERTTIACCNIADGNGTYYYDSSLTS